MKANTIVGIKPLKFERAVFELIGIAPLVMHRFSNRPDADGVCPLDRASAGVKRKKNELSDEEKFNRARYISKEGWDGVHAGAFRNAMISACRLVNFKMTMAKMSVFVEEDGRDAIEPQIPLVRIYGTPIVQRDVARIDLGFKPYVTVRAAFHEWTIKLAVRWDSDQFSCTDVTNLLARVGMQVGIGEGRPDSRQSGGMGWGLFKLAEITK